MKSSKTSKREIDIAIDLKGFTKNTRISIFSKRVAPIQISYLGYPGTLDPMYRLYCQKLLFLKLIKVL